MVQKSPRDVWSVDNDPANVYGSGVVSVSSETTLSTLETFAVTVSFCNKPAAWTCATRIPRVNIDYGNSRNFGFVLNEVLQLIETPRVDCSSLVATFNRYPHADALQVFKGYASEGVFSFLNNPLADYVIDCGCEPVFFSAAFLEQMPTRLCSDGLQFASEFAVPCPYPVKFFACKAFPITVSGYVLNSDIYAEEIFWNEWFSFRCFDCGSQIEYSVSKDKVGLPSDSVDSCLLVSAYLHEDSLSALQGEYACGFNSFPAKYTLVINYCAMRIERCFNGLTDFIGISDFADCSNSQLSREFEFFPYFMVDKVMELPIVKSLGLKSSFSDAVAGFVESFHCVSKMLKLFWCWMELDGKRLLHTYMDSLVPYLTVPIPPLLENRGFLGDFLLSHYEVENADEKITREEYDELEVKS
jgi:hypothetical protein